MKQRNTLKQNEFIEAKKESGLGGFDLWGEFATPERKQLSKEFDRHIGAYLCRYNFS